MKKKKDIVHKDLLIRTLEYCYPMDKFSMKEVGNGLGLIGEEIDHLRKFEHKERGATQLFEKSGQNKDENGQTYFLYRLTPVAIFNYLEYVELVHAKRNARQSVKIAIIAIIISTLAIIIPIIRDIIEMYTITS
ncbi:MAG: hypothetical protein ACLFVR_12505 [Thiohalospira sp.]